MKAKNILLLLFVLLLSLSASAQKGGRGKGRQNFDVEKHHQDRANYITKELNLTEKEKEAFIPLMEEYLHARFSLNKNYRNQMRLLMKKANKSESDYQEAINAEIEMKEKEIELQKEYYKKFTEVIPAEKIFKYGFAEKRFVQKTVRHYHRQQEEK